MCAHVDQGAVLEDSSHPASSPPEGVAIDKKQEEKAMPEPIRKEEPAAVPPPGAAPPNGGDMEARVAAIEKQLAELMALVSKGCNGEKKPEEEQKNAELITLRKANEELKKQLDAVNAKVTASVQKSKGVAVDNTPNSDGQPSLMMTPVMKALETMTGTEYRKALQDELRKKGGK
jgi:hypothetical protein